MKIKAVQKVVLMLVLMVMSCDEPETVVTDIIHTDGSVTRKIEMRNVKNLFNPEDLPVPFDSTWIVKDSIEVNEKGDTTWVKRAEKLFSGVEEINSSYLNDSGGNRSLSRHAKLSKKFRWFNTEFRFSESIDKQVDYGYRIQDFMNSEELEYFYSPASLILEKLNSPDSLKYKALNDSIDHKTEIWLTKTIISGFFYEFGALTNEVEIVNSLKKREQEIYNVLENNIPGIDSLWNDDILLRNFLGEDIALKYSNEADSALEMVINELIHDFKNYSVRIVMPGKLTSTNGFADSNKVLLWPVKSDYYLTQPYEMWAVSKVPNTWAWIVSALFLLFVFTGIIVRITKKG